ncbi:T9SS type A sorting domain-containing protein [Dyadobacter sp. BHUBP1]|uniref:T9SS type A sorting domain-containing protein n=1 Tax=Dyadobacter sp. BHUBP1 TaxID=3424178 RepID=UPI003D343053
MKKHYATIIGSTAAIAAIAIILVLASLISNREEQTFSIQPDMSKISLKNDTTGSALTSIQNEIAKREYHITFDSTHHALQSPNRQHNLRAYYRPGKLAIQNRIDSAGQNFRMELVNEGIYADGSLIAKAEPDAVSHNSNDTLTITHQGFAEEFINNQAGIRQNFIITRVPAHTQQLSVRLSVRGLHARQRDDSNLILYSNDGGKRTDRLTYSDLKCWDAEGKPLTASIALFGKQIEINVDVANAAYPITIDPIIANGSPANADKTLEINQSNAWLGFSVSTAGDVNGDGYSDVLVGAPKYDNGQADEGAAFLYPGTAGGISLAATVLECNQANAQMGYSVSNAGDINKDGFSDIMVGVPYYDASVSNEGVVMIYKGSANGLVTNSPSVFKLDQAEANLGISVAMAGDVNGDGYSDMLAGAHQFDNGQSNEGVGVLILGVPNGLGAVTFLECNQPNAMMGFAVASAGDVDGDGFSDVMAGARLYSNGQALEGAAFVFKGSVNGLITANPTIIESNQIDARFGHALSSAGDVNGDGFSDIALGAYQYDKGSNNEGVVMIYFGSPNQINTIPDQILEGDQIEAQFGFSVACAGDVNADGFADLIVGARYYDKGQNNEGAAFIYQGSRDGLVPATSVLESNQGDAWLGSAVAPAGDVNGDGFSDVLVGSYAFDHGQKDEGSVFVWYGGGDSVKETVITNLEMNLPDTHFGWSVAGAGDVNGDSFGDIVVSADGYDNGELNEGAAFIFYGTTNGISQDTVTIIESNQIGVKMGIVTSAGDVNGDGNDDIIIGIPWYNITPAAAEGAIFVFYGSPQGITAAAKTVIYGSQAGAQLGFSVSSAGDINRDGYADIIAGEPYYDLTKFNNENEGRAHIFYGSALGIDKTSTIINGPPNGTNMGWSVSGAGDLNADGYHDVVIGNPLLDSKGAIFVLNGSSVGVDPVNPTILPALLNTSSFGASVSDAGDINGDGFGDIMAGAYLATNDQGNEGGAIIYYGSASGISDTPFIVESNFQNGYFNTASTAGDLNGDGFSDIVMSSWTFSSGQSKEGAILVLLGSEVGISSEHKIFIESNQKDANFGHSIAFAGDLNADGYSEILVGSPRYDNNQLDEGRVFVYYGNATLGTRNNLRLYNTDLSTPINHTQFAQTNFGAGLFAKSFIGRNKGKLVWETKPTGQGFSKGSNNRITNSTQSTASQNAYSNLGTTGFELKNVIDKQGPGTKVRVRVKYDPVLALTGQSYGPWRYLPAYLMGNGTAPVPEEKGGNLSEIIEKRAIRLEEGKASEVAKIYPNPVSSRLNIDLKDKDQVQSLRILTATGSVMYQSNELRSFVDVSKLPEGAYFLIITKTDGSHTTRQILIRR